MVEKALIIIEVNTNEAGRIGIINNKATTTEKDIFIINSNNIR